MIGARVPLGSPDYGAKRYMSNAAIADEIALNSISRSPISSLQNHANSDYSSRGMNSRTGALCAAFVAMRLTAADLPIIQTRVTFDGLDRFQITWDSQPGEVYLLQTTTNLASPWQDMVPNPGLLTATTNLLQYTHTVTNEVQFFRVGWLDTKGPRLTPIYPRYEGIAVPRDSTIEGRLWDETGIDTNSIVFSLEGRPAITLADPRLSYTNDVLTYQPGSTELLGDWGAKLTATVVASDLAGNRTTNLWPFQLELKTILSTNILVIGGATGRGSGLASLDGLTLLARTGNLLMYRYSGGSSGLRNGMHLIDATPGQGYALTVLAFVEDPATKTVSVWTQPAALADLIEEGSISSRNAVPNRPGGVGQHISWEAGMDLRFEHTIPLQSTLYQWQQGENYVRAELTSKSQLVLGAYAGFAANFKNFTLKEFEAYAGGSVNLDLELYAEGNYQKRYEGTAALIAPIYGHFVIPVGGIPVEVTTKFEVDLPYELDFQAKGHFRNGIKVSKEIYMGRKWDGQWRDTSRYPPLDFQWMPVEWQVSGNVYARADVKPKMTILLYGLVGPYADLDPYLELEGWAQANPWQYKWDLYGGLDAHLGCDLTVLDRFFPNLSFEKRYELVPRGRIAGDDNLVKAPRIVLAPASRAVTVGQTASFSVTAEGSGPLSYRWQRNGQDLSDGGRVSGSRSSVLRISSVQYGDAGQYRVVVSNGAGSVTSAEATLSVGGEPGVVPGMVWIPPGTFTMGSPPSERGRWDDEGPETVVTISKGFWLGKYEVTQREYLDVMGSNPSYFTGDLDRPVEQVTWDDAVEYCNRLTARERAAGRLPAGYEYRLPTEAQWEYACRAGTTTRFSFGDALECDDLCGACSIADRYMWWCGNSGDQTHRVGQKLPNPWGLYDMHGNVWEWCSDSYSDRLPGGSVTDPTGPSSGSFRVYRGGGWSSYAGYCRVAVRDFYWPGSGDDYLGFRAALVAVP